MQIHAELPIFIYISPWLAPDDNDTVDDVLNANPAIADVLNATVPPQYGAHQLDLLYTDVEPSGYMTPAGYVTPAGGSSGFNTPFASTSRSASVDDLVSAGQIPRGWVANILQVRLQRLGSISGEPNQDHIGPVSDDEDFMRRGESAPPAIAASLTVETSASLSTPPTLNTSPAVNTPLLTETPSFFNPPPTFNTWPAGADSAPRLTVVALKRNEFSTEALCKVPSYRTARNSRPPVLVRDGLPNYESAVHDPAVVPLQARST